MNKLQRNKNRVTASELNIRVYAMKSTKHTCEECGLKVSHWIRLPVSIEDKLSGRTQSLWTCAEFYDSYGRRKPEHTDQQLFASQLDIKGV